MKFYYIRHAKPTYDPDCLTELGFTQAEALKTRFENEKVDKIFVSSSIRAQQTIEPTCKTLGIEPTLCPWAHEELAARDFGYTDENGVWKWVFQRDEFLRDFARSEVRYNDKWYEWDYFGGLRFKEGLERVKSETDAFLYKLGYSRDDNRSCYVQNTPNDDTVILLAHGGFGMAFLSYLLGKNYPDFCLTFEHLYTTGVVCIDFTENNGTVIPKLVYYNDYSHLINNGVEVTR